MFRSSFVSRSLGPAVSAFVVNTTSEPPQRFRLLPKPAKKNYRLNKWCGALLGIACCLSFALSAHAQLSIIPASAAPAMVDSNDPHAVEIGVKFRTDTAGYVTGLRFYKSRTNVGSHVGHLWSRTGTLLASANFSAETGSGWQQVTFSKPVAVTANTTYIASYYTPAGHYSATNNAFAKAGIDSSPLHALATGVDGANGVYRYSSAGAFPVNSYESTNYWVDIVFSPQVTVANPQLSVSTSSLSFGTVTVNSAAAQSVTLTSTGTSPLTISSASISGSGFTITGGSLPVTLNPNQSVTLQLQFKPTASGAATGKLTINSNSSTGSSTAIALSGTGAAAANPKLTASTSSLSFGSVTVNSATTQSVVLTSTGTSAVTVSSASISGTGFTIASGSLPVTLNPNQSVALQLQFKPTASGAVTGRLTITSNSTTGSSTIVTLSGTGTAATNPKLTVSTSTLSFGSIAVNSASTQAVTLSSTGTSAVTVNSATISGTGFTIVAGTFPVTLNPNQSVTLQLQFKPTVSGAATGKLTISSNSTTGSSTVVALTGTGTAANPTLTVSASTLSFGSVSVNTATTKTLTLSSTGTTPVTINSAGISGSGFTILGASFPVTLNPSQTLTLQLQFDPSAAGAVTGNLTLNSNSSTGSSTVVALSGTGTAVAHEVDLTWGAPTGSSDPAVGYNVYRSASGGTFLLVNTQVDAQTSYADKTVTSGYSYSYMVKSVDAAKVESDPSNEITVTVP